MLRVGLFNSMTDYFKDKEKTMWNGKVGLGLAAGAIGAGFVCPVEVSLVRMQADGKLPLEQRRNYKHVFDAMSRILREEGVAGGWRGVVCVASNPLDTAKVRMQNQIPDPATGKKPYPNLPVTWYKMVTQEGALSLWKGLFPWFLRGGGHTVFLFLFLEQYKKMYQKYVQ